LFPSRQKKEGEEMQRGRCEGLGWGVFGWGFFGGVGLGEGGKKGGENRRSFPKWSKLSLGWRHRKLGRGESSERVSLNLNRKKKGGQICEERL